MSRLSIGDPGLAPDSVLAYIEDMLMELAVMAEVNGEAALAGAIRRAAQTTPVKSAQASLPGVYHVIGFRKPGDAA